MASSTIAVRISGEIVTPGSGTALTHILTKWTPCAASSRTIPRASSSVVGCCARAALNPSGAVNPRPAVNTRGASGRPAWASSIIATLSASSAPMLRAVVTPK